MSQILRAATLQHQARRPSTSGRALRQFRFEAHQAAMLRRKKLMGRADTIVKQARERTLMQLIRRRGATAVLKHAHTIQKVLDRVVNQEEAEVDRSDR